MTDAVLSRSIARSRNIFRAIERNALQCSPLNGVVVRQFTCLSRHHPPTTIPRPSRTTFLQRRIPLGEQLHSRKNSTASLSRTSLYDLHLRHGGKMVPFAGYEMPVQYSDLSIGESHKWTREKASLFDVGHMVQHIISGSSAIAFLESITPTALSALAPNTSTLSCLLHPTTGGIVDDTVIARLESPDNNPKFYVVTNAACRAKDLAYISEQIKQYASTEISHEVLENRGLVALQGPLAAEILENLLPPDAVDLKKVYFGHCVISPLSLPSGELSIPAIISRGGYTGEDGFEISLSPSETVPITEALLQSAGRDKLRLAGLGARDSLRLEAGMCLYGHDLDDSTTPVEAGLSWIIPKSRRSTGGFHGAETILAQLKPKKEGGSGVTRRRVGLVVEGAPAREGAEIVNEEGQAIGKITSGCPSPSLGANIAMGYIKSGWHKTGTEVKVVIRGKARNARVAKMPFIETKYWREAGKTPA